ncbi:(2Fe-2S)-binding protein [Bordetella sp. BOR01]|uniref:(2Fe-2S)-binding protein n=1 Tax=Bordetella sp. BOR01 TaxID=2854779 RepID=UPI001C441CCC|nr:(2Fe-2S)-binding protein [Bordetella sp. BOR01]MBV7484906.1 (2Fe-2S)-binding protein [Bordetella sp. BOR01]
MKGQTTRIQFTLNGLPVEADIQTHHNALDVLRNAFALYGARESCGQGLCGCCTIIVDGKSVSGCLYLAAALDGCEVRTIEDLDASGELHPVQQAFIDCDAFQCGFCTSGFILMSQQLLAENPQPTPTEIKNYLAGNLCRCAAYPEIIEAVQLAATRINASKEAM